MVRQMKGARDNRGPARAAHDKRRGAPASLLAVIALGSAAALLCSGAANFARAAEFEPAKLLKPNMIEAFDRYLKLTEARNEEELKRGTNLLWIDALPANQRAEASAALKRGEVKMEK